MFSKARDLHVFLQAYQRAAAETQPVVGVVAFYEDDVKVYETAPLAVVDGLNPKTKAVPLQFTIPLAPLAPGRYECQVTLFKTNFAPLHLCVVRSRACTLEQSS